jgi:hypothetical protein
MKKLFSILFAVVFVFSIITMAQEGEKKDSRYGGYARLYSLGSNPFVVDPDNIKFNPAYSSTYSNFVWGDIGSNAYAEDNGYGQFFGVNYSASKELTLGLLLTRNDFGSSNSIAGLDSRQLVSTVNNILYSSSVPDQLVPLNNNLEVLGSYKSGNYAFGFGVSYASSSREFTPDSGNAGTTGSASQFGVNLGLIGKVSPTFEFDFAVSMILPSASYESQNLNIDASNMYIGATARGMIELSKKFSLVPTADFFMSSGSIDVDTSSNDLPSQMGFGVGLGLQYKVENLLLVGGPSFFYDSETEESTPGSPELTSSSLTFPAWNFGAEWTFNDWLLGRLGYVTSTSSATEETPASLNTVNEYSETRFGEGDFRLGIGLRFGGFNLDATVNDDVLRHGFNLIGGGVRTFAYLSASYAF